MQPIDNLIQAVRELAAESPNNVYKLETPLSDNITCSYVQGTCTNGSCGCIIGQGLIRAKLATQEELAEFEQSNPVDTGVFTLLNHLGIKFNQKQPYWLDAAQGIQDNGGSWSEAINHADRVYTL